MGYQFCFSSWFGYMIKMISLEPILVKWEASDFQLKKLKMGLWEIGGDIIFVNLCYVVISSYSLSKLKNSLNGSVNDNFEFQVEQIIKIYI